MINIRPVSDLRNKYTEIEEIIENEEEEVYLTKNGHGKMVIMSIERYSNLTNKLYGDYVENALDEADKEAENPNTKLLSHEEVFGKLRSGDGSSK